MNEPIGVKINELGAAGTINDSDYMAIDTGQATLKATAKQVKEYVIGDTDISEIGDGSVTGAISALNSAKDVLFFSGLACSAMTGNFCTKSDANITADHIVAECVFSKPSAITTDVTWITASGSLTLNGTCTDATCTATVTLVKKDN